MRLGKFSSVLRTVELISRLVWKVIVPSGGLRRMSVRPTRTSLLPISLGKLPTLRGYRVICSYHSEIYSNEILLNHYLGGSI
jgi:hypothetical protein